MSTSEIDPKYGVPDELWERLQPLIPKRPPKPKGGRPPMDDRRALEAIFYVLYTGCQWNALPRSLGASSTVHDRFQQWQEDGTFERFWQAGLAEYACEGGIDWQWNAMDGALVKAPLGGKKDGSKSHRPGQIRNQTLGAHRWQRHSLGSSARTRQSA